MANPQEENSRNQAEQIKHFHKLVSNLEKINADLAKDLEQKDICIHELKKNAPGATSMWISWSLHVPNIKKN